MTKLFTKQLLRAKTGLFGTIYALRKTFLTKYRQLHYSQYGEDVVLADWLKDKRDGFFVDVGCYHPKKFSNTYALYKRGWRGVNIDLHDLKIKTFNLARPADTNILAAVSNESKQMQVYTDSVYSLCTTLNKSLGNVLANSRQVSTQTVTTQTLDSILANTKYRDREIDLLSIDAEGHDMEVLCSLNLATYKPKLILIESHSSSIKDITSGAIYRYLEAKGYYLANWVGYTLFFVSPDCDFLKQHVKY